ncbi:MAG: UxaA family hydrolase [Methanomassiliicoccales archaeon]|nr:UxaA family hydrolase [Methanomassiliicoccales archaeon]
MKAKAIKINEKDNVATALTDIKSGETVMIKGEKEEKVKVIQDIPFGHKFALTDISKGSEIIKYGEVIGRATSGIRKGEHVHVHNIESLRGRGDLSKAHAVG